MGAEGRSRGTYQFTGLMRARSSISHIGETHGIETLLRREAVAQPDGTVEEVPCISGNSWRGLLRDCGMRAMLRALGDPPLGLPAFHFLFSGGSLTKSTEKGLDLDLARRLCDMIPLVSVFGGAVGNQIMEGKLRVGKLYPICRETAHLLGPPLRDLPQATQSIWSYLQQEAHTRRDDAKREPLRVLLHPETRRLLDLADAQKRARAGTPEDVDEEHGQHQQMRYLSETFVPGTLFRARLVLLDATEIEFGAFLHAVAAWMVDPVIGGMSGRGMGEVDLELSDWLSTVPTLIDRRAVAPPVVASYEAHLSQHRDEIVAMLGAIP